MEPRLAADGRPPPLELALLRVTGTSGTVVDDDAAAVVNGASDGDAVLALRFFFT